MLALAERLPFLGRGKEEVAQSRGAAYLLESPGSGSQSVDRSQSRKSQFRSEHCSSHAIPEAGCLPLKSRHGLGQEQMQKCHNATWAMLALQDSPENTNRQKCKTPALHP